MEKYLERFNKVRPNLVFYLLIVVLVFVNGYLTSTLVDTFLTMYNAKEEITKQEEPTKISKVISVEIINASGITGLANKLSNKMRLTGFDVINTGNYPFNFEIPFNYLDNTVVIDRTGNLELAIATADSMGLSRNKVTQIVNKKLLLDVTVLIGKDLGKSIN